MQAANLEGKREVCTATPGKSRKKPLHFQHLYPQPRQVRSTQHKSAGGWEGQSDGFRTMSVKGKSDEWSKHRAWMGPSGGLQE